MLQSWSTAREFHRGRHCILLRSRLDDGRSVVLKTVRHDARHDGSHAAADAAVLRHEYEILHGLEVPGVVRALALDESGDAPVLVLQDAGETNLAEWRDGRALDTKSFFEIAIPIAEALAVLHQRAILHRDLSPTNIVLDAELRPTLVDFDAATHVTAVAPVADDEALAGTLPYMAPEQTGRMQRPVDHRSDLYALGAIYYELITATLPLVADDPAALVHAILAGSPKPPEKLRPDLPVLISDVLLRLLAKMPEQRYQSAEALVADLRTAQRHWLTASAIPRFEIGTHDRGGLVFPDRLVGRQAQESALLECFARVRRGAREIALVSGPSGVGKTALVSALRRQIEEHCWFGAGQAELLAEATPHGVFSAALRELAHRIVHGPEAAVDELRRGLAGVVGATGRVLAELVPELEPWLGQLPDVPSVAPVETENRLHLTLLAFLRLCATEDHPLVLFLDDLQWADPGSLKLLELIASAPGLEHVLVVAAYRTDPRSERLEATVRTLHEGPARVVSVELAPLDPEAITAWLSEVLACGPARASPLAKAVHRKTGGDPLSVTRLLRLMHRSRLLVWDPVALGWRWDLSRIEGEDVGTGEDVIALMLAALQGLPVECRALLAEASCLGSEFDLWLLSELRGEHVEATAVSLAPALREGLIAVAQPRYRANAAGADPSPGFQAAYRFVHDRVRQAARALLTKDQASLTHVRAARALHDAPDDAELERRLFDVVGHYHLGAAQVTDPAERLLLCALDHRAGRKAMRSASYEVALGHLQRGLSLLPGDAFSTHRALALGLHLDAILCAYIGGQSALGQALLDAALAQTDSRFERVEAYEAALLGMTAKADFAAAIECGRAALREFGFELPAGSDVSAALTAELQAAEQGVRAHAIDALLGAPEMRNAQARAIARVLASLTIAAWVTDQALVAWMGVRLVNLSLRHGNTPASGMAYALYGHIRAALGDITLGRALGQAGLTLSRRFGDPLLESKTLAILGTSLNHWGAPLRTNVPILQEAVAKALEAGEVLDAVGAKGVLAFTFFSLDQTLSRTLAYVDAVLAEESGARMTEGALLIYRQAIRCLQGHTHGPTRFDGPDCDQAALDAAIAPAPALRALYEIVRLQVAYLGRDFELAGRAADADRAPFAFLSGFFQLAEYNYYSSLTWAARADLDRSEAPALLARIAENQAQLARWADGSPDNFRHKHALVAAEVARLRGEPLVAGDLYDQAIEGAARAGFTRDQALASELAGRFRLALGRHGAALSYFASARAAYRRWGATAKVRALAEELPALDQEFGSRSAWTDDLGSSAIDLHSVIKASETISRELELEPLIACLMDVCLEVAGAERGALLLQQNGGLVLRAVATRAQPVKLESVPLEQTSLVPVSVVEETWRTADALVLTDAVQDARFAADPYVARRHVRSVLAVPIVRQAAVTGVLYLENNLATHVFTASRVRILQTLSSQIAVSLAHSRLFDKLKREIEERRRAQATLHFLAESTAALGESLDYRATLAKAAQVAVPFLGDGCVVDMLSEEGDRIERVAVAHVDPAMQDVLRELQDYPPRWEAPDVATRVLQSGEPMVVPELNDQVLESLMPDAPLGLLERVRRLGTGTMMSIPLRAHGQVVGVMHLGATASGRRYGPEDLSLAQELARRMALAIENARLYRESQRAIHVRDEFLSVASHELRTPLQALQLSVQTTHAYLARTGQNGEIGRKLALIDRQTNRIARLVEMLLDVSRIHAGRLDIELEQVDLNPLVREVAARFAPELTRAGCTLELHLEPSVVGTWDRLRLDQVITNLLSNAIKFGAGQPIEVGVESAGELVRIWVRDRGIGIAAERQRDIFGRFERAVSTRAYGGLGLGLYISHTIVEALGGTIRVASEPGSGSTFTVELPRTLLRPA